MHEITEWLERIADLHHRHPEYFSGKSKESAETALSLTKLCKAIEIGVNVFGFPTEEIANEIYNSCARDLFKEFCCTWVRVIDYVGNNRSDLVDPRNEISVRKVMELMREPGVAMRILSETKLSRENILDIAYFTRDSYEYAMDPCVYLSQVALLHYHRTNQQTLTGLVLKYLDIIYSSVNIRMREKYGVRWWHSMMI